MMNSPDYREENKLAEFIQRIDKPTLSTDRQEILKSKIMQQIVHERSGDAFILSRMTLRLAEIAREVVLPLSRRFFLKERLLAFISVRHRPRVFQFHWMKLFAPATLALFLTFLIFNPFIPVPTVKAAPSTEISEFSGTVEIIRNGILKPAVKHLRLQSRDFVQTHGNSGVTIRFLDDSVIRLSENTSVRLQKLSVSSVDRTQTVVELELLKGMLWARVVSLVDKLSKFQVKTDNTLLTAQKSAAFNVSVNEKGKTEVTAVKHAVEVTVAQKDSKKKQEIVETTLVNGYQLNVENEKTTVTKGNDAKEPKAYEWIAQNLEQDQTHIQTLKEEYREERLNQAEPKKLNRLFVFDEFEKERTKMRAAEAKLTQAEALLEASHGEDATALLKEFSDMVSEISARISELEKKDPAKTKALREELNRTLRYYKKQFSLLLPSDDSYEVKEAVLSAEVAFAETPVAAVAKKLEQAGDHLMESQALVESDQPDDATAQLQKFQDAVTEAVGTVSELESVEQEEAVSVILDAKASHLKLLEALFAEVSFQSPPALTPRESRGIMLQELLVKVKKAKQDSLAEVGEVLATSEQANTSLDTLKQVEVIKDVEVNLNSMVSELDVKKGKVIIEGNLNLTKDATKEFLEEKEKVEVEGDKLFSREIQSDPYSGITVITIEVKPSQAGETPSSTVVPEGSEIQELPPVKP